jgi:hypothetical protein
MNLLYDVSKRDRCFDKNYGISINYFYNILCISAQELKNLMEVYDLYKSMV